MKTIQSLNEIEQKKRYLKKGSMHFCKTPDNTIKTFVKNKVSQCLLFDTNNGQPSEIAKIFADSDSYWYW